LNDKPPDLENAVHEHLDPAANVVGGAFEHFTFNFLGDGGLIFRGIGDWCHVYLRFVMISGT
jgi:hypothetical protein